MYFAHLQIDFILQVTCVRRSCMGDIFNFTKGFNNEEFWKN